MYHYWREPLLLLLGGEEEEVGKKGNNKFYEELKCFAVTTLLH